MKRAKLFLAVGLLFFLAVRAPYGAAENFPADADPVEIEISQPGEKGTVPPASEVLGQTSAKIEVKVHPRTGLPLVTISGADDEETGPYFLPVSHKSVRPDYRMLDPKVKAGEVAYEGPVSNRTKVYVLAASLAAAGTASSLAAMAAVPAATGSAASGGAGAFAAAGAGVVTGTTGLVSLKMRVPPTEDNFKRTSESHSLENQGRRLSFGEIVASYDRQDASGAAEAPAKTDLTESDDPQQDTRQT